MNSMPVHADTLKITHTYAHAHCQRKPWQLCLLATRAGRIGKTDAPVSMGTAQLCMKAGKHGLRLATQAVPLCRTLVWFRVLTIAPFFVVSSRRLLWTSPQPREREMKSG